jgi:hypothetical protein
MKSHIQSKAIPGLDFGDLETGFAKDDRFALPQPSFCGLDCHITETSQILELGANR